MAVAIRTQRNIGVRLLMLQAGHPMVNSICNIHDSTARHTHIDQCLDVHQIRDSIVVSISACHAEDPGSIPGRGICSGCIEAPVVMCSTQTLVVELWGPARGFVFLARWLELRPHGRERDRLHASAALGCDSGEQKLGPALASSMEAG